MASRVIDIAGPYTIETIRKAMRHFASLEWTAAKKIPLAIRVHPDNIAEALPEKIDGVPVEITQRCQRSVLEMDILM